MNPTLRQLLDSEPRIWNGRTHRLHHQRVDLPSTATPTGMPKLDNALPDGGWPRAGVAEIQTPFGHPPPLRLLLPAVATLSQAGQRIVLINPPFVPFAPALQQAGIVLPRLLWLSPESRRDTWWAIESALRTQTCGMVLAWAGKHLGRITVPTVRRWQVAATAGTTLCVLFSDGAANRGIPNVHLRLRVEGQRVQLIKARGTHRQAELTL